MKKIRIAVLGANSHIAKGLINNFLQSGEFGLHLYTRHPDKVNNFLSSLKGFVKSDCLVYESYSYIAKHAYDVVINCVGVGTLNKLKGDYTKYFTVTEEYDGLIINYLRDSCPDALYISFSSGAVYGKGFSAPVNKNTANSIRVNHVAPEDYYGIVRLNSEAKHRSFKRLNIVDLRLFSYFSRYIDLTDNYFIADIMNCILKNKVFITDNADIVRDYVHPDDLFSIIRKCIDAGRLNQAFDVISSKPVGKKEILAYFSSQYGLKYKMSRDFHHISATGAKNVYYSKYANAPGLGYKPEFSSIDTIKQESKYILSVKNHRV